MKKKILIGSPIKQKTNILKEFLLSLQELETDEIEVSYCFVDDNDDSMSSLLLRQFADQNENVLIWEGNKLHTYHRDDNTHYWNEELVWNVADYKNRIIEYTLQQGYDYLFFIDSDLVLHPRTLQHLVQLNKDIVAEVFWTKWEKNSVEFPQVWLYDHYTMYEHHRSEVLDDAEIKRRTFEFLNMLKIPGVYEVGGLGACTLFSKAALEKGVNFSEIKNVTMWGEDRHLCIRAAALGIKLFADTHFPAYHIYRESDLTGVQKYKKKYRKIIENEVKNYILDTVITVMEAYVKYGERLFKEKIHNGFTSKMLSSLLKNQDRLQIIPKKGRDISVCYPKVVSLEHNFSVANVQLVLIESEKITGDCNEDLMCDIELTQVDKEWVINKLHIKQLKREYTPVNIKKNKKITLVYTSNSGSNILALYKDIPFKVKDKYTIELVRGELTDEYIQKIVSSDVVVITEGNYFLNKKMFNPNQIIIDLGNGFPLKARGFVDNSEVNKNKLWEMWGQVNYMTSYSEIYNKTMNKCIKIDPNKYVVTGQPRNDLLFKKEGRECLFRILDKKDEGKNVIFYMPTLIGRQDEKKVWGNLFDFQAFNSSEFQAWLQEMNCEIVVKLYTEEEHKLRQVIEHTEGVHLLKDEMLASNDVDLYEVLGAADLLITDYSSVYFDYLLLDKPIIFIPVDDKEYGSSEKFLLTPYEEWTPGPKVLNQKSLQIEIKRSLESRGYYQDIRKQSRERIHQYQDFRSTQRVWDLIEFSLK